MRGDLRVRLVVSALLLTALAGCTTTSADRVPPSPPAPTPSGVTSYAALGDSYTAAPFVPRTDLAGGCFRSSGNYPALLAEDLDIPRVRDVSCSGADTGDLARSQVVAGGRGKVAPQLDAVTPGTDLVTIGIGGNDENVFGTLVQQCTSLADRGGSPCTDRMEQRWTDPARVLRRTSARVGGALRLIHEQAPRARALLIGYPRLVDPSDPCPLIPLAPGDVREVARLELDLRNALADAARRGGATFVDMYARSRGHEICSADPWVNGFRTNQQAALAYHPFAAEQRAVADAVESVLESPSPAASAS